MKRKTVFFVILALAVTLCSAGLASVPSPWDVLSSKGEVKAKYLYVVPSSMTLRLGSGGVGETRTVKATAKPLSASQLFNWTSSNTLVATVDENGAITATGLGTAKVTCFATDASGLKRNVKVTVKPVKVKTVTLSETAVTVAPNTSKQLGFTLSPENAYDKSVKWISSNANVATVDENGVVTAKKLGSCVITCKSLSSGVKAKARVNVSRANSDVYYLAIGQENYLHASVLKGCNMDADRFAATVKASTFGGTSSPVGKVYYDLTAAQIKSAMNDVKNWGMDENDVVYVFYSGHGSGFADYEGALIGIDYNGTATKSETCVKVSDIRASLDAVPGTVIVAVDACYSGNFITAKSADGGADFTRAFISGFSSNIGVKSLIDANELRNKYKIMVACQPDELSYMIGNGFGSVFTQFVTQAGGVWGADTGDITVKKKMAGDSNGDGAVTLKEIFSYAYTRVIKALSNRYSSITQHMMVWPTADSFPVFARLS